MLLRKAAHKPGSPVGRIMLVLGAAAGAIVAAPGAQAQVAGYDTALRSIAPATINQANFDVHARSPVLSIGPTSVENRGTMVPAIYDPSLGHFVSALGSARGAIAVNSASAVSVVVGQQNSILVTGLSAGGAPTRTDTVSSPAASIVTAQITAAPANR